MGSRAIVVVCRDEKAAARRFGPSGIGCIYTRNGRPFFEDPTTLLRAIRDGLTRGKFWGKFSTDWVCIDGELLPWTLKAEKLIEHAHGRTLLSGEALLRASNELQSLLTSDESERLERRMQCFRNYRGLIDKYLADAESPARFAPFQIIATEGRA
jgi:protein phosphatase